MIAIIDYGMGNLHSVRKAFEKIGAAAAVTQDPAEILRADKVVLPGVGAFGDCMFNLTRFGLDDVVRQIIRAGKPFLGICLGLQLLFEGSEEAPGVAGLGIFPGMVRRIQAPGLKVPHMGWNRIDRCSPSRVLDLLPQPPFVYFVHSYHAVPADAGLITATADYGGPVTAAIGSGLVQAVQFHPEKSGIVGLTILQNFKELM